METYLNSAQIILAIVLVIVFLLQVRGGGLGGIFGQQTGMYRTKRGIEKTIFRFTIALMVIFVIISIFAVRATG
ncbi:MAG TPA: preprotein translocase subunit SecG [Dehalococcoidia bacterium]|jgi:preprotein translocase subunit SecG|nr:preprotein translocase subunit SecG [Dehalococcoidia bacterium]